MDKNGWRLKRSAHSKYLSLGYALLVLPGPHAKVSADDGAKFKSGLNADKYFPAQHWTCLKSRNFWTFDGAEDLSQIKSHPSARLRRPNWMWHRLEIKNLVPLYTFHSAASFFLWEQRVSKFLQSINPSVDHGDQYDCFFHWLPIICRDICSAWHRPSPLFCRVHALANFPRGILLLNIFHKAIISNYYYRKNVAKGAN